MAALRKRARCSTTRAPLERSMIAPDTTTAISDSDYATFIAHLDQFGLDLGQKMASENQLTTGNLNYSPLSVSYAQAMTYAGARGDTASEMKSVLGDSFADGVFHQGANRLMRELASGVTSGPDSGGNAHRLDWSLVDSSSSIVRCRCSLRFSMCSAASTTAVFGKSTSRMTPMPPA
jgi:hypothetical protein